MQLHPPQLHPGDTIAIVAPAGKLHDLQRYEKGCSVISAMGFEIAQRDRRWPGTGYLADNDQARLDELHGAWANPDVRAIFALRGGFGSARLLAGLDLSIIRRQPKFLVGFSDISILHSYINQKTGLTCLHGPVISTLASSDTASIERLYQCLLGNWHHSLKEKIEIVRSGPAAKGPLLGGNLSSLLTLFGTPYCPDFTDAILFLEDVNEPFYRLDRLLTQFAQGGHFQQLAGIILGDFSDDRDVDTFDKLRRHEFVWSRVRELTEDYGMPIWGNFPAGHGCTNISLPIGAQAKMDSSSGVLSFPT